MKKLNNSAPSGVSYTEDWLPIRQIMNGMIQLDDGSYVTGVKVAPKNIFIMDQDGNQLVWILYLGGLPGGADLCDSGCCGILYLECYVSDDPVKADRRKTGTDSDQTWDFLIKEWGRT